MRVLATRRNMSAPTDDADSLGVVMTDLDTVLRESDFVSLHLPLSRGTRHMIDASALSRMKPSAYLINTSRGALVDEHALVKALHAGQIAGAGLDTFAIIEVLNESGPPDAHPLMHMDNVLLSPHVAAGSDRSAIDSVDAGIENIEAILGGFWPVPEHRVNPEVIPRVPLIDREAR